jgi:hypothetical protein
MRADGSGVDRQSRNGKENDRRTYQQELRPIVRLPYVGLTMNRRDLAANLRRRAKMPATGAGECAASPVET